MDNHFVTIIPELNVKYEGATTLYFEWLDCFDHKLLINKSIQFNIFSTYFDKNGNPDLHLFEIVIETYHLNTLIDKFSNLVSIFFY